MPSGGPLVLGSIGNSQNIPRDKGAYSLITEMHSYGMASNEVQENAKRKNSFRFLSSFLCECAI